MKTLISAVEGRRDICSRSGCFLPAPLFWRRLSGTFQVSELCSRGVWSLLHCYGGVHGWHLWGRRATAAHRHHCPSLQGDHPDRSFEVWNPFETAMLGLERYEIFSAHQSPNVDPFLQLVVQFCVVNAPHHGEELYSPSWCFFITTNTRHKPHIFLLLLHAGFNPIPAKHHACNCRI